MNSLIEPLTNLHSVSELKDGLRAICEGIGQVTRLEVLVAKQIGRRRALCFLRMATTEQEQTLMRELQVGRFGGDVIVIVDLKNDMQSERDISMPARLSRSVTPEFQSTLPIAALIKPSTFSQQR